MVGLDTIQNDLDLTDFDDNHKVGAIPITEIVIAETAYEIDNSYTEFDALIVSRSSISLI